MRWEAVGYGQPFCPQRQVGTVCPDALEWHKVGMTVSEANPKGYNFQVRVTSGHEAEATAVEKAKKPNRMGMFIVKLLGYKGNRDSQ